MTFQIHKYKSIKVYQITDGTKRTYLSDTAIECVNEFQSTGLKELFRSYNEVETIDIEFETIDELINLIPEEFL